jgi:hypothetical protein
MRRMLAVLCVWALPLLGCGLDGVRGEVIAIHEDGTHIVRDLRGQDLSMSVDARTHQDAVQVGDRVQAFIDKQGHAEFIQRLE